MSLRELCVTSDASAHERNAIPSSSLPLLLLYAPLTTDTKNLLVAIIQGWFCLQVMSLRELCVTSDASAHERNAIPSPSKCEIDVMPLGYRDSSMIILVFRYWITLWTVILLLLMTHSLRSADIGKQTYTTPRNHFDAYTKVTLETHISRKLLPSTIFGTF